MGAVWREGRAAAQNEHIARQKSASRGYPTLHFPLALILRRAATFA